MTSTLFRQPSILVFSLLFLSNLFEMSKAGTIQPSNSAHRNLFAAELFGAVAKDNTQKNVIFSPASIQSCVALAFFGAGGQTAKEIRTGLKLGTGDITSIGEEYQQFLRTSFSASDNGPELRMANRIYVNEKLELVPTFNATVTKYFDAPAESVNFADATTAVNNINNWVEEQTENKIKDLLQPGSVNSDTSSILVNAIYFKGKWEKPFSQSSTQRRPFAISAQQKVTVDMMYLDEKLRFGELPKLDATAIELPYENSDISMLIILPKKIEGLRQLEEKLVGLDLNEISSQLEWEDVDVLLPKFKIEFEIDLKQPLQKLGMATMFSSAADFSNLFTSPVPQKIGEAKHKAFLDVNEAGSEAAAATFFKIVAMSLNLQQKSFRAEHPFFFAIRSANAVYFAGHVATF